MNEIFDKIHTLSEIAGKLIFVNSVRPYVDRIGLNISKINLNNSAYTVWYDILVFARDNNKLIELIDVILESYPNSLEIKEIKTFFIEQKQPNNPIIIINDDKKRYKISILILKLRNIIKNNNKFKVLTSLFILVFIYIFFKSINCFVSNFFSSYREAIKNKVGLNAIFLTKKDSSVKFNPWEYAYDGTLNTCSLNDSFNIQRVENIQPLLQYICLKKDEINIVFHIEKLDKNYSGFKIKLDKFSLLLEIESQKIWYRINCDELSNPIYNEFLLGNPNLEGDFEFKAKIIKR